MKDLLYKEFRLAGHPTMYIFPLFALMLLIPSYPYYVAFIYTCLEVFFIFLTGRENKDIFFTACLPVRKSDIVRSRCAMIAVIQLFQIAFSVPFAILGARINPNALGNVAGIEANVAFFGLVFGMFAAFNVLFIPTFYKTGAQAGRALCLGGIAMAVYIVAAEGMLYASPALKAYLDTTDAAAQVRQLPILFAGMLIYAGTMFYACRRGAANFERVDL